MSVVSSVCLSVLGVWGLHESVCKHPDTVGRERPAHDTNTLRKSRSSFRPARLPELTVPGCHPGMPPAALCSSDSESPTSQKTKVQPLSE